MRWLIFPSLNRKSRHGGEAYHSGTSYSRIPQYTWLQNGNTNNNSSCTLISCRCTSFQAPRRVFPWRCLGVWSWPSAWPCKSAPRSPPCCSSCNKYNFNYIIYLSRSTHSTCWGSRSWRTCTRSRRPASATGSAAIWSPVYPGSMAGRLPHRWAGRTDPCWLLGGSSGAPARPRRWVWLSLRRRRSSWIGFSKFDTALLLWSHAKIQHLDFNSRLESWRGQTRYNS